MALGGEASAETQEQHPFEPFRPGEERLPVALRIKRFRASSPATAGAAERRSCLFCEAGPGELCRTQGGRLAWYHFDRLYGGRPRADTALSRP